MAQPIPCCPVDAAKARQPERTVLFLDEVHRFNKSQQDAFLPFVEAGDILLIGATTENPSFEVIGALLSRARTLVLEPLADTAICPIERDTSGDGQLSDNAAYAQSKLALTMWSRTLALSLGNDGPSVVAGRFILLV